MTTRRRRTEDAADEAAVIIEEPNHVFSSAQGKCKAHGTILWSGGPPSPNEFPLHCNGGDHEATLDEVEADA